MILPLVEQLKQQADRHTACGKNCVDARLLREAAQSLEAMSQREQQLRKLPRYTESEIVRYPSTFEWVNAAELEHVLEDPDKREGPW